MAAPITAERLVQELEKLHGEMSAGAMEHGEYDQRLSRIIQELRDRGISADREKLFATLQDVLDRGVITPGVKMHLEKRLGLV